MKYLISIAWRSLENITIEEFIKILSKHKNKIDGIELSTKNYFDMFKTLQFCILNNLIFQCHTPKLPDENKIFEYLDDVNKLSIVYNKSINVVLHPLENDDFEVSILETINYIKEIISYIKHNNLNIIISLENLNFHHNRKRINVNEIDQILIKEETLKFTYDIGHDIFDNQTNTKLTKIQKQKINNLHLHNINENKDHQIINSNKKNIKYIKKALTDAKKYTNKIVLEVGIDFYKGENYQEKIINYINSIEEIKNI